ncbi:unnamed protein product, partial [Rhizoctonia solani]
HILRECSPDLSQRVLFGTTPGLEALAKFIAATSPESPLHILLFFSKMDPNIHRSIVGLFDEVLIHILHLCNYQEILRFARTCRRLGNLVSNTVSLQLHIELEANGFEVISGSGKGNINYQVVLKDLRRYLNGQSKDI